MTTLRSEKGIDLFSLPNLPEQARYKRWKREGPFSRARLKIRVKNPSPFGFIDTGQQIYTLYKTLKRQFLKLSPTAPYWN
jgi:hypothetical protein